MILRQKISTKTTKKNQNPKLTLGPHHRHRHHLRLLIS